MTDPSLIRGDSQPHRPTGEIVLDLYDSIQSESENKFVIRTEFVNTMEDAVAGVERQIAEINARLDRIDQNYHEINRNQHELDRRLALILEKLDSWQMNR